MHHTSIFTSGRKTRRLFTEILRRLFCVVVVLVWWMGGSVSGVEPVVWGGRARAYVQTVSMCACKAPAYLKHASVWTVLTGMFSTETPLFLCASHTHSINHRTHTHNNSNTKHTQTHQHASNTPHTTTYNNTQHNTTRQTEAKRRQERRGLESKKQELPLFLRQKKVFQQDHQRHLHARRPSAERS